MARQEKSRQPKKKFSDKGLMCDKCKTKTSSYTFVKIGGRLVVRCTPYCESSTTGR